MSTRKTPSKKPKVAAAPAAAAPRAAMKAPGRKVARTAKPAADAVAVIAVPAMAAVGTTEPVGGMTPKEMRFVAEYLVDLNGTRAYMRAYPQATENTARNQAAVLLRKPVVAAAVAAGQRRLNERAEIQAEEVVRRLGLMATADERELMEVRVASCRYCHGEGHRYHYTAAEMERAEIAHAANVEAGKASGDFDQKGGTGYNANELPHLQCPECFGDGIPRAVFKDTRKLSEGAALLFAGVKVTKDGFEVKVHSREAALVNLARIFGLFEDKLKVDAKIDATDEMKAWLAGRDSRLPLAADQQA